MYYYEFYVKVPNFGYSVLVQSENELSNEEVINKALEDNQFEEDEDANFVEDVYTLTEKEAKLWLGID